MVKCQNHYKFVIGAEKPKLNFYYVENAKRLNIAVNNAKYQIGNQVGNLMQMNVKQTDRF
jgi:hypothetical protein